MSEGRELVSGGAPGPAASRKASPRVAGYRLRAKPSDTGLLRPPARFRAGSLLALAIALVAPPACGDGGPRPLRTPNVVLVTIDTVRADHLEAYGYERSTAPVMARLAAGGVRFEQAVAQAPWTLPSMASLHTSLFPRQHGAVSAETAVPEAAETLAELLQRAGYRTVGVVSHEFIARKHGFAQGFDLFDESNVRGHDAVTSRDLTLTALARLSEVGEPFFLWVHYFDPHFTYVRHPDVGFADGYGGALPEQLTSGRLMQEEGRPMAAPDLAYVEAVYDEEIAHTDAWLGRLWDGIEDRYGRGESVLIVTADHGEYFLERGRFFHGKDVYAPLVNVPLLIAGAIDPGLAGTAVPAAVEIRSIPATVMGLLGIDDHGFAGQDLLAVARGAPASPAFTEGSWAFGTDERKQAVVEDGWKLIHDLDSGRFELYELAADPQELRDLWPRQSDGEVAARLQRLLVEFTELPRLAPQAVGLSPEAIERLRALGYIR